MYEHGERDQSPYLDVVTRRNSIFVMHELAIKFRYSLSCTTNEKNIAHKLVDDILIVEDWNHIYNMEQWLLVLYLQLRSVSVECAIKKETLRVEQKVNGVCLQYFI
jgi:hypothetical protein